MPNFSWAKPKYLNLGWYYYLDQLNCFRRLPGILIPAKLDSKGEKCTLLVKLLAKYMIIINFEYALSIALENFSVWIKAV